MLIEIPPNATPEVQKAFRDIADLFDTILGGRNVDFKGRRIINAGDAAADQDYVTRLDVVRMIRASGGSINGDGSAIGNTGQAAAAAASASTPTNTSAASQLAGDLARVSLRA